MCRSNAQGGRRCRGGKCAESRRARQRAYQARKRAAAKAQASVAVSDVDAFVERITGVIPGDRSSWTGVFADLKPAIPLIEPNPEDEGRGVYVNGSVAPWHVHNTLNALRDGGRFALLDTPLTDADREEIAGLSPAEMSERVAALRDHFGATLSVSMADKHHEHELAERVTLYMGDVTNTWLDGQTAEQLEYAREFMDRFEETRNDLDVRQAECLSEMEKLKEIADPDEQRERRMAVYAKRAVISDERAALRKGFDAHAKSVADARADALVTLMSQTVGTSEAVPVAEFTGSKKALAANLGEVERFFPDSWKHNTLSLRPLVIRQSSARAHYCGNSPVKQQHFAYMESDAQQFTDSMTPVPVVMKSRRRYEEVETLSGGDPDNPSHVAIMEEERDRLNQLDADWLATQNKRYLNTRRRSKPRWEVFTNGEGCLALRETFPSGTKTVGYEAVIRVDKGSKSTLTHELAHRMEHANPYLHAVCAEFVRRRSTDENGVRERPIRYYRDTEPVYKDNLINAYMGKMYSDKHNEVLSTGMEMLMHGRFGAGIGLGMSGESYVREDPDMKGRLAADQEHLNLITGLLVSAPSTDEDTGN